MISAGDFKNGLTFEMDGNVMQVIEFQHVKPGKGAAFVRAKLKNVISGATLEQTFNPTAKFAAAVVERKDMQYSYSDGDLYYFMDNETYDQVPLNSDKLPDSFKFVKEGMECRLVSFKGNVFSVEPPMFVELEVDVYKRQLEDMYCSPEETTLSCQFCGRSYAYSKEEIKARLFRPAP